MPLATLPPKKLCALTALLVVSAVAAVLAGTAGASGEPPVPDPGGDRTVNEDETAYFYGDAYDEEGDDLAFSWEFPDGSIVDGQSADYTFGEPGEYTVTLWVDDGTSNVSAAVTVTVLDVTPPDTVISSGDRTVDEDTLQAFDGSESSDNVGIVSYDWEFEDAGFTGVRTGDTVDYTWETPGYYMVTLYAADAAGNVGWAYVFVTVLDVTPPTASFDLAQGTEATVMQAIDGTSSYDNVGIADFAWTVEDAGSTETLSGESITFTWNAAGTFAVTLTVTDGAGLTGSASGSITVLASEPPSAIIDLPAAIGQGRSELLDGSGSTDNFGIADWAWTVEDDGFTVTLSGETATYEWTALGTFAVTLTVTDFAGNTDEATAMADVVDLTAPLASFSLPSAFDEDTEQTLDGTASTDNQGIVSYTWYVEDWGGTFTFSSATVLYTWYQPRAYEVTLKVVDAAGNVGTLTQTAVVLDVTPPTAAFTLSASFDEDTLQALDGRASDDNVGVVSWEWLIEGAGVSDYLSGDVASYVFEQPGTFTVTLAVGDAAGNTGTRSHSVTVFDVTPPTALPSVAARFRVGYEQTLDGTSSFDNVAVVDYAWVVADDGFAVDLSGATVTYTWTTPGTYAVTLTVTDAAGLSASETAWVEALEATPPVAAFDLASPFDEDALQTLDGSGSTDNVGVVEWQWLVEDAGQTASLSGAVVSYAWATPGTYAVTLTVADEAGNTDSKTLTVEVLDITPPTASFDLPASTGNDALTLDGSASFDNVGVVEWEWTLEDAGGDVTLSGESVTHAWSTPGTYAVRLTARDAAGNAGEATLAILVLDTTAPAVRAGPDQTVSEDALVTFDGTATGDNDPEFPTGASFRWTFEDGGALSLAGTVTTYTFRTPGTYWVRLTVTDAYGNAGSDTLRVTVLDVTPPFAEFQLASHVNEDTEVALYGGASTDNVGVVNWTWTIGDRAFSATLYGSTSSYMWTSPGTFEVTLTVYDAAGNAASRTYSVVVMDTTAPIADAGADLRADEDTLVTFDAAASTDNGEGFPSGTAFLWIFRDGPMSLRLSGASVTYTFASPGLFAVMLLVVDSGGNLDTDEVLVTVLDVTAPIAAFSGGDPQTYSEDTRVRFDASGSSDNDPAFSATGSFRWTFVDGAAVSLAGRVAEHLFATPGSFEVALRVTDAAGNFRLETFTVVILDATPPVALVSPPSSVVEDQPAAFDGRGATDNVGVVSWTWTFEGPTGGSTQTSETATFTWETPGTYTVTLRVADAAGLFAVASLDVVVLDVTAPTGQASVPATAAVDQEVSFSSAGIADNDPGFAATRRDLWTFSAAGQWVELEGTATGFTFRAPGTYAVHLHVLDAAGNAFERTFELTVPDTTAPWLLVFTPEPDLLTGALKVRVTGTVELGATLRLNDQPVATTNGAFDIEFALLEGTNALNFVARDAAGNEVSRALLVRAHTGAPVISVTSPQNGAVLRTATARLEGRVTDALTRTLSIDGEAVALAPNGAFSVEVPLVEGANALRLEARDEAGNANSLTLTLVRDSQAPVLGVRTVGTFLEGTNITTYQSSVPVAGTTEPGTSVRVCVEGASGSLECHAMTPASDGTFWHDAALRAGTTTKIRIEATDAAMNTAVDEFTVVQKAAPAVAVENPNIGLLSVTGLLAAALAVALVVPWHRRRK